MLNIRPGHSKPQQKRAKSTADNTGGMDALCNLGARFISTAVVILILAALFHAYIKLNQDINTVKEEISRTEANIAAMKRDIETQDMRLATYSTSEYIKRQIRHFNLPLVELRQDQQIRVKVYTDAQLAHMYRPGSRRQRTVAVDRPRSKNIRRGYGR